MRCRAWITLVVTTALLLSSPGAAAEPLPPLPPSWVAVEPGESSTVRWGAPATGGGDVSHYVVYRGDTWMADVSGFSWVDLAPDGAAYSVAAVSAGGESVAVVGLPAPSPGDCVKLQIGMIPPFSVSVWDCIDPTDATGTAESVSEGPLFPNTVVKLPPPFD